MNLLEVIVLLLLGLVLSKDEEKILQFNENGEFKIVQFADLHFGEAEALPWGPQQDINSTRVMRRVLGSEKDADLVVFSGDQVTGNNIKKNATSYYNELVKPCVDFDKKWVIIFGNHDDAPFVETADVKKREEREKRSVTTRKELMAQDKKFKLSYSKFGPKNIHGESNYYYTLRSSSNPSKPVSSLFFLDSGGGSYPEIVYEDQVNWYVEQSKKIETDQKRILPAIVYVHIPVHQYKDVFPKTSTNCFGMADDGVSPQLEQNKLFQSFQQRTDVKAMFVGHNHGNDWCCPYKNIQLCYGRHTGYGGYGKWKRGARVTVIKENPFKIVTWVRMEDGSVIHEGTVWPI